LCTFRAEILCLRIQLSINTSCYNTCLAILSPLHICIIVEQQTVSEFIAVTLM
jgi:hypothetical protein